MTGHCPCREDANQPALTGPPREDVRVEQRQPVTPWIPVDLDPTKASDPAVREVLQRFADEHPTPRRADWLDLQVWTPEHPDGYFDDDWCEVDGR